MVPPGVAIPSADDLVQVTVPPGVAIPPGSIITITITITIAITITNYYYYLIICYVMLF